MLIYFEVFLLISIIIAALATAFSKRLLSSVIIFTSFSLIMSILWVIIKSPDLAITEAAVGAGITSILFFIVLKNVEEINIIDRENLLKSRIKFDIQKSLVVLFSIGFLVFLLITVSFLPTQGSPTSPQLNEVVERYIELGTKETGATNIVAAMILDYRAFDTFGEAVMLFTATMAVVLLLKEDKENSYEKIDR